MLDWTAATIIAWLAASIILCFGEFVERVIGQKGLSAIERLMGMLLLMISVQMFLNGIFSYFEHIKLAL